MTGWVMIGDWMAHTALSPEMAAGEFTRQQPPPASAYTAGQWVLWSPSKWAADGYTLV